VSAYHQVFGLVGDLLVPTVAQAQTLLETPIEPAPAEGSLQLIATADTYTGLLTVTAAYKRYDQRGLPRVAHRYEAVDTVSLLTAPDFLDRCTSLRQRLALAVLARWHDLYAPPAP